MGIIRSNDFRLLRRSSIASIWTTRETIHPPDLTLLFQLQYAEVSGSSLHSTIEFIESHWECISIGVDSATATDLECLAVWIGQTVHKVPEPLVIMNPSAQMVRYQPEPLLR